MHLSLQANRHFVSLLAHNVSQTEQILSEKRFGFGSVWFFFSLVFFLKADTRLVRICNSETSSCGVHSGWKLEWTQEESPAQSNVKRPKCDFERLTECCNKVNNKSCSKSTSGCLGADGTSPALVTLRLTCCVSHLSSAQCGHLSY